MTIEARLIRVRSFITEDTGRIPKEKPPRCSEAVLRAVAGHTKNIRMTVAKAECCRYIKRLVNHVHAVFRVHGFLYVKSAGS